VPIEGIVKSHKTSRERLLSHCIITIVMAVWFNATSVAARKALETPINGPSQLAFDSAGNLYVSEYFGHRIVRIDLETGAIAVIAGNGRRCCYKESGYARQIAVQNVESLTVDRHGNVFWGGRDATDGAYVRRIDNVSHRVTKIAGSRSPRGTATSGAIPALEVDLSDPKGLLVLPSDALLVSTDQSNQIVQIHDGIAETFVGGNLPADHSSPLFRLPGSLATDRQGNIFVADYLHNCINKIERYSHAITTIAGNGNAVESGDGGPATEAGIPYPISISADSKGDVFVLGNGSHKIRRIDVQTGIITTIAGKGERGLTKDNVIATNARISPVAIAIDSGDNIYFSEVENNRIRRVDITTGVLTTVAGNGLPKRKSKLE
jgi:hypothetical protein